MKSHPPKEEKRPFVRLSGFGIHPGKSVGARLFFIFFFAMLAFVLSLGLVSYQMSKRTIEQNAVLSNRQTVNQTAEKLDLTLRRYEDSLQQSLFGGEIQDLVRKGSLKSTDARQQIVIKQKLTSALGNWAFSNSGVLGVCLIPESDAMQSVTSGMTEEGFLKSAKEAEWFREALAAGGSVWMAGSAAGEGQGTSSAFHLVKALPGSGREGYVIVANIKTSILTEELNKINLGGQSTVQLVAEDHRLIASSAEAGQAGYEDMLGTAATGEDGSVRGTNAAGENMLTVYGTLGSTGWKLVNVIPVGELVKDAKKILLTTYLTAIVVAFLAVFVGLWMARTIAGPLNRMKELMRQAAKGDLRVRMTRRSRDEIGELSLSFNEMLDQITALVDQTGGTALEVLETAYELGEISRKTAGAAKEIAGATEQIAAGASSMAQEAERGSDLTGQMSGRIGEFVAANREMSGAAADVGSSSERGIGQLLSLEREADLTGRKTEALVDKVNGLKAATLSVLKVLDVMQNITNRTSILSLNASIEAARAGASGKGFMVVAGEIRALAEQSRESIDMVGRIADGIMNEMNETVQALSEVTPQFDRQREAVRETNGIFHDVRERMEAFIVRLTEVTASVGQLEEAQLILSDSMSNVSAVAEQSSAASEEVASLSGEQQAVSEQLVQLSGKLELASVRLKEKLSLFKL
ncbi:methyl-accepting chemotaxis protein [Paenibacillus sp. M1]|uniref:Methyl-accepting chemotaxis protein n=1 Tax=Paenibacillus haidiansis TaxID=1574488 RepID=A0ABU7VPB7_9BACL